MIGPTFSHFRVDARIGQGGMGEVFLATDIKLGRRVALKVLSPELLGKPGSRERFLREARAAAAIDHPNMAAIYAVERHGDQAVSGTRTSAAAPTGPSWRAPVRLSLSRVFIRQDQGSRDHLGSQVESPANPQGLRGAERLP